MDALLKFMLSRKTSREEIAKFCLSKKNFCTSNSEAVCKRILEVSGYITKGTKTGYCPLYTELHTLDPKIKMSYALLESAQNSASKELRAFLILNGYTISPQPLSRFNPKFYKKYLMSI